MNTIRHLYFHIPFCPKLCPYCCFYVETGAKHKTTAFLDALLRDVEEAGQRFALRPETIYFGGGTPSALLVEQLDHLLGGLRARLDLSALAEWSFEVNPATVRAEKARLLRAAGVTRISLGVQSWDDATLRTLGRVHDAEQAEKTYAILRAAGFENINLDLMFAVPGQTAAQWAATLAKTVALQPEHVSAYCLTYEEDTAYFRQLQLGTFRQDHDFDADLFETTMDTLGAAGFAQYEISNYARAGRESAHNFAYWRGADYLGFGPSAFSTVGRRRWQALPDTGEYTRRILAGESVEHFVEELAPATREGEIAAFAIRTREGLAGADLARWAEELREFEALGFLERKGDRVILTRRGRLMADAVAEAFV
ncbi:MAG: radical SAM family heme chaperone HemW [Chthoniobacter sp.]|nr:radical SAM family heme chaperone HemW [Chthoniobacter sp.]